MHACMGTVTTMVRIYHINWIDPETGFIQREEFKTYREMRQREIELKAKGVRVLTVGHYETGTS